MPVIDDGLEARGADLVGGTAVVLPVRLPACEEVLAVLREPVVLTDLEWRIGFLNPAAERLLGRAYGELVGRALSELLRGDYTADPPELGRAWRAERVRRGWIVLGASPQLDGDGDGWMQRMIEAEQLGAVGQIAAGVAHEIGAPLTAISVAVEYLIRGAGSEAGEVRRDLELILAQTQRISRLTRRLVELARPTEPAMTSVDLNLLVRESLEFIDRQLQRDEVEVVTELAPELAPIRADGHQIQQVLLNLLLNAHRAVASCPAERRRLEIRTLGRPDGVELVVEDTGPGIAPEDLQRIFLPFFSRAESTGMGLTVVRNIVHQHGGTVEAHSRPGRGASFHVRLPGRDHGDSR